VGGGQQPRCTNYDEDPPKSFAHNLREPIEPYDDVLDRVPVRSALDQVVKLLIGISPPVNGVIRQIV
jgi:hypothetical protein